MKVEIIKSDDRLGLKVGDQFEASLIDAFMNQEDNEHEVWVKRTYKNWNELMPVVHKISTYTLAYPEQCKKVIDCKIIIRQDILRCSVVEFIKWYNSLKETD